MRRRHHRTALALRGRWRTEIVVDRAGLRSAVLVLLLVLIRLLLGWCAPLVGLLLLLLGRRGPRVGGRLLVLRRWLAAVLPLLSVVLLSVVLLPVVLLPVILLPVVLLPVVLRALLLRRAGRLLRLLGHGGTPRVLLLLLLRCAPWILRWRALLLRRLLVRVLRRLLLGSLLIGVARGVLGLLLVRLAVLSAALRSAVLGTAVLRRTVLGTAVLRTAVLRAAIWGSPVLGATMLRAAMLGGTMLGGTVLRWRGRRDPWLLLVAVPALAMLVSAPGARQIGPAAQAEQIARLERFVTDRTVQGRHDTSPARTPARSSLDVR